MVREHYPLLFKDDPQWENDALEFVAKTYELVEFLTKVLKVNIAGLTLPTPTAVTYHTTPATRGLHMNEALALDMLKISATPHSSPRKFDQCCGFGGTFAINTPTSPPPSSATRSTAETPTTPTS